MLKHFIPRIAEFPDDGLYWKIDWFGAVEPNPNIPTEPYIQLVISPLKIPPSLSSKSSKNIVSISSSNFDMQRVIRIGVGQLPLVSIGSVWKDGVCQPFYGGELKVFNDLDISKDSTRIISANHEEKGHRLISYRHYRYGGVGTNTKLLAIRQEDDPYSLLIPMTEVLRFYYAVSTNLSHAIFAGSLKHDVESVINPSKTGFHSEEKRFFLGIRRNYTDEESWIIARILNSQIAWNSAVSIHDELMKQSLNENVGHIKAQLPFFGKTNITARYKKIKSSDGVWRHLLLAIEYCTGAFPFESLTVYRDNDGRRANPHSDIPVADKKPAFSKRKSPLKDKNNSILQSICEPDNTISREYLVLPKERFGALENKKIDKVEKEFCAYVSKPLAFKNTKTDTHGTASGGYKSTNVSGLSISPKRNRRKGLSSDFGVFVEAIDKLNKSQGLSAKIRRIEDNEFYIPLVKAEGISQWSYLDSSILDRRAYLVADITFANKKYSLIEFEQRKNEKCTIGLILSKTNEYLNNTQLHYLMFGLARAKGVWKGIYPQYLLGCEILTMKHTWNDSAIFAESIKNRIV